MNAPVTVLVAARNEALNITRCLEALRPAERVVVLDSHSDDETAVLASQAGAEVVQFDYAGTYPKKRQWALDTLTITTPWVLLIDADEVIPPALWQEIVEATQAANPHTGYLITKGYHFLGRRFQHGGFSFEALLLFQTGKAAFEYLIDDPASGLDMEVHERLLVNGSVGRLRTPLIHDDFKGLDAYIDRHNRYSTWEAQLRYSFVESKQYGKSEVQPKLFGNAQERRRFLKRIAVRTPFEPLLWFVYHYFLKLGFLEGRAGLIASTIRANYISQVRAKMYELKLAASNTRST